MEPKRNKAHLVKANLAALFARIETLKARGAGRQTMLAVVARPDDEALGSGATLATMVETGALAVIVVMAADDSTRRKELDAAAVLGLSGDQEFMLTFPDGRLSKYPAEIRAALQQFADFPDIVITHKRDVHPDHRVLYHVVRQVFMRGGVSLCTFAFRSCSRRTGALTSTFAFPIGSAAQAGDLFAAYASRRYKDYFDRPVHEGALAEAGRAAGSSHAEGFEPAQIEFAPCANTCGRLVLARRLRTGLASSPPRAGPCAALSLSRTALEPCPLNCGQLVVARNSARDGVSAG